MTNHVGRLYALAVSVVVLFVAWVAVATHPWQSSVPRAASADPRLHALVLRERRLRRETILVRRVVARRWHRYRIALAHRNQQIANARRQHKQALASAAAASAAPSVQVVSLPPLTITRTS